MHVFADEHKNIDNFNNHVYSVFHEVSGVQFQNV